MVWIWLVTILVPSRLVWNRPSTHAMKWRMRLSYMWMLITFYFEVSIFMWTHAMLVTSENDNFFAMEDSLLWTFIGKISSSPIWSKYRWDLLVSINNFYLLYNCGHFWTKMHFFRKLDEEQVSRIIQLLLIWSFGWIWFCAILWMNCRDRVSVRPASEQL